MKNIKQAALIRAENDNDADNFQSVHVFMGDDNGDICAVATMTPYYAREFAADLIAKADIADARVSARKLC